MVFELLVAGAFALATLRRLELAADNSVAPWTQPCGTPVANRLKKRSKRHSVHRALHRVLTQLRVAKCRYAKDHDDLHKIYGQMNCSGLYIDQYMRDWLPQRQLKWYYNEVLCLEKAKKAEHILPRLYNDLQKFAIAFYHLKNFQLKSAIKFNLAKRNEIINGMYNEILKILCEVETAIQELQLPAAVTEGGNRVNITMNMTAMPIEADLTTMLIQDWGVLLTYNRSLNSWKQVFRNATAKGPACDINDTALQNWNLKKNSKKRFIWKGRTLRPKIRKKTKPTRRRFHASDRNNSLLDKSKKRFAKGRLSRNKHRELASETTFRT